MKHVRVLVFLLMFGATPSAMAADSGFYFGLSGGEGTYDFEPLPRFMAGFGPVPSATSPGNIFTPGGPTNFYTRPGTPSFGSGLVAGAFVFREAQQTFWVPSEDDEATAWSVLAGYRIFRFAALELAYTNFGTLHRYQPSFTLLSAIVLPEVRSEMESQGGTLSAIGILPITDQWDVYLRAGGVFADQDVTHRSSGAPTRTESYDSESWLYGIGTQVDFGEHWTVRVDFQRYDDVGKGNGIGQADIDVLSLGVLFRL